MKKPSWFQGIFPAIVTPMTQDGKIAESDMRGLVRYLLPHVSGFVVCGTTGEFSSLTIEERKQAIRIVVEEVQGKCPVIAGTGGPSTWEAMELTQYAKEIGATAALVVTPYYFKVNFNEIYDHYQELNKIGFPLIAYNIPQCAGSHQRWFTTEGICDLENVIGVKDSSGDLSYFAALTDKLGGKVALFCGNDEVGQAALGMGADGLILASANLIPDIWQKIYHAVKQNDLQTAQSLQAQIQMLVRIVVCNGATQAVGVVFTSDTLYLFSESEAENMSMLKADIGIGYLWSDNLRFSLLSDNLLTLKDGVISEINNRYIMKTPLKFRFAAHYQPLTGLNLSGIIGTGGDFYFNSDYSLDLFNGRLFFGGGFFSSVSGERLNALTISAGFGTENWGLSVTGFNYLNDENKFSLIDFNESAISDIYHNRYSSNKLNAGIYYRINRVQERYAEITELKIVRNIFTGLGDMYLTEPFAMAKVYNFSDEAITLRPSSKIEGINSEPVYSELVRVNPGDTALVKFYTIVNEKDLNANPRISSAEFSIYTLNDTPDDTRQIPVLIHGKNSWDGNVSNLRYFALSEMDYSLKFAREILSGYKNQLDTIPPALSGYYKARMVYDEVVRNLQYVSDPNANTDRVQYPSETIKLKGGDCDDLSVLFSSLFESIGIETAFVDYKSESGISHVNLLFNTGLAPEFTGLITENDKKYYIRKDAAGREYVWLPLEATILKGFDHAWETGSEKFYEEAISGYGLLKNKVEIIEVY